MASHIPRKRFGQNFLQDRAVIADIVSAIDPRPGDAMVEIGPGLAALTEPLLQRLDHLHVVEIDRDIVARLRPRFPAERLTIHAADALKFDFRGLAQTIAPGRGLRVVGNLPYNISTPLLFHLADAVDVLVDGHFMLQNEVVLRMVAEPGCADYGRLSVMLQVRFEMEKLLDVPPEAFDPAPKVDSAIVRMTPRPIDPAVQDLAVLARLVAQAFAQRRKTLRNNLRDVVTDAQFATLGIDPTQRPEQLPVSAYVALANLLAAG
jgi:16S rRNA (adenine1518-N6/adenine1519-N6)-dimethyltransferase